MPFFVKISLEAQEVIISKFIIGLPEEVKEYFQFKKTIESIRKFLPASSTLEFKITKEAKNAHLNLTKQLLERSIDLIIYPLDKMPLTLPKEVTLSAVTERILPYDSFLSIKYPKIEKVPKNSSIGVKSQLQKYLIKKYCPGLKAKEYKFCDLDFIKKLTSRGVAGIILAGHELLSLKLTKPSYLKKLYEEKKQTSFVFKNKRIKISPLSGNFFLPVPFQGILGIEAYESDIESQVLANKINHYDTFYAIRAERAFLYTFEEKKKWAVGVLANIYQNQLLLNAVLIDQNGNMFREKIQGLKKSCEQLGYQLAQKMKNLL